MLELAVKIVLAKWLPFTRGEADQLICRFLSVLHCSSSPLPDLSESSNNETHRTIRCVACGSFKEVMQVQFDVRRDDIFTIEHALNEKYIPRTPVIQLFAEDDITFQNPLNSAEHLYDHEQIIPSTIVVVQDAPIKMAHDCFKSKFTHGRGGLCWNGNNVVFSGYRDFMDSTPSTRMVPALGPSVGLDKWHAFSHIFNYSPDGSLCLRKCDCEHDTVYQVLDAASLTPVASRVVPRFTNISAAWCPLGERVLLSLNADIGVWDIRSNSVVSVGFPAWNVDNPERLTCATHSGDHRFVVLASSRTWCLWEWATMSYQDCVTGDAVLHYMQWCPVNSLIVAASCPTTASFDV